MTYRPSSHFGRGSLLGRDLDVTSSLLWQTVISILQMSTSSTFVGLPFCDPRHVALRVVADWVRTTTWFEQMTVLS